MKIDASDHEAVLMHYGILRRSGRYPWGSGGNVEQRSKSFFDYIAQQRAEGLTDPQIAQNLGMTTTDFRIVNSIAKNQKKAADISRAEQLKRKGMSNMAIGEAMGINESSVRSLLAPGQREKNAILLATANMLRDEVNSKGMIDVGKGVEHHLKVSKERLATALSILKNEGYAVHTVQVDQVGTGAGNKTLTKVLAQPGTKYRDIVTDLSQVKSITKMSEDGGRSWFGLLPTMPVDSKRVRVVYGEEGGSALDGVIYVRPGKDDLSMGGARYAQVRINVDGTHYIKGMAMYHPDLPRGVDLQFHTNKTRQEAPSKLDALKQMKDDPDNPFGAVVRQLTHKDADGKPIKVKSAMNLVNEEGDWDRWKNSISSQVLSKQSSVLAKTQLDMTYDRSKSQLEEIMSLTNPTVRRKLLEDFAEQADSSAVHLKAASLPRQRSQVLLPINSLKQTEIYAPNFRDGERVVLIRYPHSGPFEIPQLTVNNKNREAQSLMGRAADAVGIHSEVAKRLSGADFDGDSVLVIPNPASNPKIKTSPPLEGLKNFDPQSAYKGYEGMPTMSAKTKATQMGLVSNLITDMTIRRASDAELAAAVRHSMVVIDAEKHGLNWKQSAIDNGIPNLMKKYQGKATGGSSTLISRATSRQDVRARKPRSMAKGGPVDKATGKKVYEDTGEHWVNAKGKVVYKMQRSTKLAETDDARTLSSGTKIEEVYADHSNRMKSLANLARKTAVNTDGIKRSASAAKVYDQQVKTLTSKLRVALENSPRERQAQILANTIIQAKRDAQPDMDAVQLKKVKSQALDEARRRANAKKTVIKIEDDEWEAIQAGAISNTRLKQILDNADPKRVRELATPKTPLLMSTAKTSRARQMAASGYTQAEIADALGVSLTTLKRGLSGDG